jgi:dipeptidyl aminopeptidase/acylaminoacyl peptidase
VVSLSPDQTRVATSVGASSTKRDIWIYEVARDAAPTRLTFGDMEANSPIWSPDGSQVIYRDVERGGGLFAKAAGGMGPAQTVVSMRAAAAPNGFSPTANLFVYMNFSGGQGPRLWMHDFAGSKDVALLDTTFDNGEGQFSPNGRWLAYTSGETGGQEVYVTPFPGMTNKWRVSTGGGSQARWRRDLKELYYIAPDARMMAVPVQTTADGFRAASPRALFQTRIVAVSFHLQQYDVRGDGQRFLINSRLSRSVEPLTLEANWTAQFKTAR